MSDRLRVMCSQGNPEMYKLNFTAHNIKMKNQLVTDGEGSLVERQLKYGTKESERALRARTRAAYGQIRSCSNKLCGRTN